jgi:hypothetical protein
VRRRQSLIVSTLFAKLVWNCASDRVAGPLVTDPFVLYCEP